MSVLKTKVLAGVLTLFTALSMTAAQAGGAPKSGKFAMSGNIGLSSQYIFRGLTNAPEDNNVAIQGGFDWTQGDKGFYFGYWGSSLGYSESSAGTGTKTSDAFENDLYIGYKGKVGSVGYDVSLLTYVYANFDDANTTEFNASVGLGPVTVGLSLNIGDDVRWSNKGDLYYYISAEKDLPRGFKIAAKAGFYEYESTGQYLSGSNDGFRHFDLTLSRAIGKTGAEMSVTAVFGGHDRGANSDQDDAIVFGISYNFDI